MADEIIYRTGIYQQSVEGLLAHINQVKTMLWAGDIDAAQVEIGQVMPRYRDVINKALEFKKGLMARRRNVRKQLVAQLEETRARGDRRRALSAKETSFIRQETALRTRLQTEEEVALFVIVPVAALAMRLYKMFFNETEIQEKHEERKEYQQASLLIDENLDESSVRVHEGTGFRYLYVSYDNGRSETRAYRLNPPTLTSSTLIRTFQEIFETTVDVIEKPSEDLPWPLWLRAFTADALIELTVFDPGRVAINLTTKIDADSLDLILTVFKAIFIAQQEVRDEYKS